MDVINLGADDPLPSDDFEKALVKFLGALRQ